MKAVRIHKYGGPRVLTYEDVPRPEPNPDELLLRVHAAGVNPADWKVCCGRARLAHFPQILGWDISGVIETLGRSVSYLKVGDAVFGTVDIQKSGA